MVGLPNNGVQIYSSVMAAMDEAGEILRRYFGQPVSVQYKTSKDDMVSVVDFEADALLRREIGAIFPDDAILSEEYATEPASYRGRVWMIDPLDDSKGYLAGRDTGNVMVGLCDDGVPIFGAMYLPLRNEWYYAEAGKGAYYHHNGVWSRLHTRSTVRLHEATLMERFGVGAGDRPLEKLTARLPVCQRIALGSGGKKLGLVAAGNADISIHTSFHAGKWDTLAAHVLLVEAGGAMCDIDGKPLDYTQPGALWQRSFIGAGSPALLDEVVARLGYVSS